MKAANGGSARTTLLQSQWSVPLVNETAPSVTRGMASLIYSMSLTSVVYVPS